MENPRVTLLGTSLVVPATPTERRHMYLPSLDLCWQDIHYNQRLIFYRTSSDDQSSAVDCLKRSLSLVLVHFYPWAGRLAVGEHGRIEIDCNDLGVEFIEASIDLPFSDLEKDDFQMKTFFDKLSHQLEHKKEHLFSSPLLSIQVTQFSHGGLALAVCQSHVVADGQSLWHFMVSWSECGRGVPISTPPLHDRTVLTLENPSEERARLNFDPPPENEADNIEDGNESDVLVQRVFHLSAEALKKLKSLAAEEGRGSFSSYEVLCAHFWKCVTRARRLKEERSLYFAVLVNCRSRLSPPLPSAYFGNVIMFGMAFATAGEVGRESLAATAARIHTAVVSCNDESLHGYMNWLELHNNRIVDGIILKAKGMMVASSPRFPVYEADFGWGRPAAVRPVKVHGDGEMVLFASRDGKVGSVDVCMPLTVESMERLEHDAVFLDSLAV